MARTIIIDTAKIPKNPTTAHTRNALMLGKEFGLPVVGTIEELQQFRPTDFDKYVISGSAFYPQTADIDNFIRRNPKSEVIWLNNEWQCAPNSEYNRLIKDHRSTIICNLAEEKIKANGYDAYFDLNVNLLLFELPNKTIFKKYPESVIYYGSYRLDRRLYLAKYFDEKRPNFYFSSTKKNLRKFKFLAGCRANFCDKLDWTEGKESLNLFGYALYVEDEFSHKHYTSPANRFYEALHCNVVQFFDESCKGTFRRAGMDIQDFYFVNSANELSDKISLTDFDIALKQQQVNIDKIQDRRNELLIELENIILCN